jgi:hypothetical protein
LASDGRIDVVCAGKHPIARLLPGGAVRASKAKCHAMEHGGLNRPFSLLAMSILLVLGATSCGLKGAIATTTPEMSAVLSAWRTLGLTCGGPQLGAPDAAPEWQCSGELDARAVSAHLVGGASGPQRFDVQLGGGASVAAARSIFARFARETPIAADARDGILRWLSEWDGADAPSEQLGAVRAAIDSTPVGVRFFLSRAN